MHLEDKPILKHVVNECLRSAKFLSGPKTGNYCSVAILTPYGDEISKHKWECEVIQGDEHDVLSRYVTSAYQTDADYIVRITGDCPALFSTIISKCVNIALKSNLDFVSNAPPHLRTSIDGHDCEILSRKALSYIHNNAMTAIDREHVTRILYESKCPSLKYGMVLNNIDMSHIKLSIDTPQEYEAMSKELEKVKIKADKIMRLYGKDSVYKSLL